jgi:hypothetical protein
MHGRDMAKVRWCARNVFPLPFIKWRSGYARLPLFSSAPALLLGLVPCFFPDSTFCPDAHHLTSPRFLGADYNSWVFCFLVDLPLPSIVEDPSFRLVLPLSAVLELLITSNLDLISLHWLVLCFPTKIFSRMRATYDAWLAISRSACLDLTTTP